jgi:hypothetical protein
MRGKQWMLLLVALLLAVFAGTGQAATIWATNYENPLLVSNPGNALGAPNGNYATIGSLTLLFGSNFLDLTGSDVVVVDAVYDKSRIINVGDIYSMTARRSGTNTWSDLTFDTSLGGYRYLEIAGNYSGLFDAINLTYLAGGRVANLGFEVDAVGVNNPLNTVAPVPEPGTMMLLGSGLVGMAIWGRKKFRK